LLEVESIESLLVDPAVSVAISLFHKIINVAFNGLLGHTLFLLVSYLQHQFLQLWFSNKIVSLGVVFGKDVVDELFESLLA
jgi:hypothetical protein